MAYIVPYQEGMCLGRTFHVLNNRSGKDIFSEESTSNPKSIYSIRTSITCKVIQSSEDVNKFFNISGGVSLWIKAGFMNVEGMGEYLTDDKSDEKCVEILAKTHVQTVTETMTSSQPIQTWRLNNSGTHYVRSITYGGELLARISITGSDSENQKEIREKVKANINFVDIASPQAKQSFKKMEEEVKNSSEINICYYCTGFSESLPRDIDGMFKALEDFPVKMKQINNGKKVPLRCELVPLTQLETGLNNNPLQKVSSHRLKELEDQYDDIRIARTILEKFRARDDVSLADEHSKKAKKLEMRIDDMHERLLKQTLKKLPPGDSLNIVLFGKSGHGKSATGNIIFGEYRFEELNSMSSVTRECKLECGEVGGRKINLVDTPGTMDTKNVKRSLDEIGTAIAFCPEGYHAFLLILRYDVRMTKEEWRAIKLLKQIFGRCVLDYTIIVFTHGDFFFNGKKRKEKTILEYIQNQEDNEFKKLVKDCGERCCIINNSEKDFVILREQVIEIITLIDKAIYHNDGKMYTNDLFHFAQAKLQKEREDLKTRKDRIKNAQKKELDALEREKEGKPKEEVEECAQRISEKRKQLILGVLRDKSQLEHNVGQKVAQKIIDSGRQCFPPDALIRLQDGTLIQLADLRVGDKILSFVSHGIVEYSEVYFFAHLNPNKSSQYITISTSDHKLKLTPDHHLYTVDIGGSINTFPARKIKVGDRILVLDEDTPSLKEEVVTNLSASIEVGIYAPITMSGTIIVDNVLASCYVDIVPPKFSHPMLWPLRQLYRMAPSLSARINTLGKGGYPAWIKFIMNKFLGSRKQL
ncbi:hypothetical protein CHS0354_040077 [Potamilus streckersoni]|uniref:AIG1-type G domain-containing protein n=1 Tax=Potamilus streckersoni TaxID=2493646 RepID=A0AAE0STF0_9BIVA|nr:hypothetical protein CHS0354_040077 [Potamilus streckersoni]